MAYTKQNFVDGQILEAEHLNFMEKGIEEAHNELEELRKEDTGGTVTKSVEFSYDGNSEAEGLVWATMNEQKPFVKVGDIPQEGEFDLVGGTIEITNSGDSYNNYYIDITEETFDTTVEFWDVECKSIVNGLTQVMHQKSGKDGNPITVMLICTRPGIYTCAFDGWLSELVTFNETGIYFLDNRSFGGDRYVSSLTCSLIINEEGGSESPIEYDGHEMQVFSRGICIGDSITEGVFNHSGGEIVIKKYAYPSVLKRLTNIDIVNAGIAGLTSQTWYNASKDSSTQYGIWVNGEWEWTEDPTVGEEDIVSQTLDYSGFDFAIIHLGINDIGMMGSATLDETIATFEANINNIVADLKAQSKGIKIFLCTIIPCYATQGNTAFDALNAKIRDIASNADDVYLIDLNGYSDLLDGTAYENQHLTAVGYHKMASEIMSLISYTISQNLNDFKSVQFIGTSCSI